MRTNKGKTKKANGTEQRETALLSDILPEPQFQGRIGNTYARVGTNRQQRKKEL